ncbi:recombinase RecA [Leptolyngbya sp. AN10]|uniref:recombinase RecA n=1 Tax=Leptolyngbya sp. AN10 TaxID=3423365 RepID=UPI003D31B719
MLTTTNSRTDLHPSHLLIRNLQKDFPKLDTLASAGIEVKRFSSQCPQLDQIIDGGYPIGRFIDISGPEASGKTTLLLHAIAEMQQLGKIAALIDAEHKIDPHYAKALGVNLESLIFVQPRTGEEALEIAERLVQANIGLVGIDSIAALVPEKAFDQKLEDSTAGLHSELVHKGLNRIGRLLGGSNATTVIATNQLRFVLKVVYGTPEKSTGGVGVKYHSSLSLDLRRIQTNKLRHEEYGIRIKAKITKNITGFPFRKCEFDLNFGSGIDQAGCLLEMAKELGVLEQISKGRNPVKLQICESLENDSTPQDLPQKALLEDWRTYLTSNQIGQRWLNEQIRRVAA